MCHRSPGSAQWHLWLALGSLWLSFGEPGAEPTPGLSLRGFVSTEVLRRRSLLPAVSLRSLLWNKGKQIVLRSLNFQDITDLFSF